MSVSIFLFPCSKGQVVRAYLDYSKDLNLNFYFILGKSRSVSLADKQNLPFCEAFLWEVQRMSCVAPAGLEHRATESIPFHGFIIPKGTVNVFLVGPLKWKRLSC